MMWKRYENLWEKVMTFLAQKQWVELSAEALEEFLGKKLVDETVFDRISVLRFYEWFLWDYTLSNGKKVYDYFFQQTHDVKSSDAELLASCSKQAISIFKVKDVTGDKVTVLNMFTRELFISWKWADELPVGQVFVGRWFPSQTDQSGQQIYIPSPSIVQVPSSVECVLFNRIEAEFGRFSGNREEFCRKHGHKFEFWIEDLEALFRDEHLIIFSVRDYFAVIAELQRHPEFRIRESKVVNLFGPIEFSWVPKREERASLTVCSSEILISANDWSDLDEVKMLLYYVLEDRIELVDNQDEDGNPNGDIHCSIIDQFRWPRRIDRQVAKLLESMMGATSTEQLLNAVKLWNDFCCQELPLYRKPEVWAAAIEYTVQEIDAVNTTKEELITKYDISRSSFTDKYRQLKKALRLEKGDCRYSSK